MDTPSNEEPEEQESSDIKAEECSQLGLHKYEDHACVIPFTPSCESITTRYQAMYFTDPHPECRRRSLKLHSKVVLVTSVLLIGMGLLSCTSNLACMFLGDPLSIMAAGIWGGTMFILTGSLGICSNRSRKNIHLVLYLCMMFQLVLYLVFALLSTIVSVGPVVVGAMGLSMTNDDQILYERLKDKPEALKRRPRLANFNTNKSRIVAGLHGFIIFAGLLSCILALLILVNACNTILSFKNQVYQPSHTLVPKQDELSAEIKKSPRPLYLVKTYRLSTIEQ